MHPFRYAAGFIVLFSAALVADEVTIDGFSNYYRDEGVFDWAKNCKLVADLPPAGTQLPAPVRMRFQFEHDQERLSVFRNYSTGTRFDLGFYTASTPFAYNQTGKYPTFNTATATVRFDSFDLRAPAGTTSELKFEIYGDCDACSTQEALPPNVNRTTWRVFATIDVTTDANGRVVTCRLTNPGSEEPAKQLPSRNPNYYPARLAPRPDFYTPVPCPSMCGCPIPSVACPCQPVWPGGCFIGPTCRSW